MTVSVVNASASLLFHGKFPDSPLWEYVAPQLVDSQHKGPPTTKYEQIPIWVFSCQVSKKGLIFHMFHHFTPHLTSCDNHSEWASWVGNPCFASLLETRTMWALKHLRTRAWNRNEMRMIRTMPFPLSWLPFTLYSTLEMAVLQNTLETSPILNPLNKTTLCLWTHTSSQCTLMDEQMLPCLGGGISCNSSGLKT